MSPLALRTVSFSIVVGRQPELRSRLDIDLEHAAELVELGDVARAEIGRQRGEHLVECQTCSVSALTRSTSTRIAAPAARNEVETRCIAVCVWRVGDHRVDGALQLGESKLPSRSSTCMVKPPALPMPWIGGGGSTRTRPSSTCRQRRRLTAE